MGSLRWPNLLVLRDYGSEYGGSTAGTIKTRAFPAYAQLSR